MTVCDYAESLLDDGFFNDDIEQLPDNCSISYYNISKFLQYKDFEYNEGDKVIFISDLVACVKEFKELYYLWENFRAFGLPSGSGWMNEKPVVLDIVKCFNKWFSRIEDFLYDKRKMKNGDFFKNINRL